MSAFHYIFNHCALGNCDASSTCRQNSMQRVPVAVSIKCIYKLYKQLEHVRCISCASSSTCNLSEIWAQTVGSSLECQLLAALQCGNWPAQKVVSNCHLLMKKIARQSLAWYFHYKGYWSNSSAAYSSYAIRYVVYSADFWHWTDFTWV